MKVRYDAEADIPYILIKGEKSRILLKLEKIFLWNMGRMMKFGKPGSQSFRVLSSISRKVRSLEFEV